MTRLSGKIAFITGGGSGIGRAAASLFAREGAAVAIIEINADSGAASRDLILSEGGRAIFLETDITDEDEVRNAVERTRKTLGSPSILFNCAGGSAVEDATVTDVDMAVWDRTINLDLKGTFLCCRHVIPEMIHLGGGSIVNMSSGAALRGSSPSHIYTAAKGAILSLTRAIAGSYAQYNIRANSICSGRVMSERIVSAYGRIGEQGRIPDPQNSEGRVKEYPFWVGEPEEIASIALFLASDESRMMTGATVQADGGRASY